MAKLTIDKFIENLKKSQLLSNEQFEAVCADIEPSRKTIKTRPLTRRLIKEGLLTPWQVKMLSAGQAKFFLGNYKLLQRLGRGGGGTVFKAEHTIFGRIVALKLMFRRVLADANAVTRFHQEIQSAAALDNQHVVRAFDAAMVGTSRFLVMEYVDGEDLRSILDRRGKLPIPEACEYIRQAALGLQHAHEKGMVHRDIKPANLILTWQDDEQPLIKIFDMGLARLSHMKFEDDGMTREGQIMGTLDYMSPEQGWDSRAVDIRGDIFGLGCTLFHFLSGCLPFQSGNSLQKLIARCSNDAPPIREFAPEITAQLEAVVQKMLARHPGERYQTPRQVVDALAPFAVKPTRESIKSSDAAAGEVNAKADSQAQTKHSAVTMEVGFEQFLNDLSTQATPASMEWSKPDANMNVQVRVTTKNAKVKTVNLTGDTLIGRGPNCQLRIASSDVSREHCCVRVSGSTVMIRDLGSANGTMVNGKLIAANEDCILTSRSRVKVGPMSFVLIFAAVTDRKENQEAEAASTQGIGDGDTFDEGDGDRVADNMVTAIDADVVVVPPIAQEGRTESELQNCKAHDSKMDLDKSVGTIDSSLDDVAEAKLVSDEDVEALDEEKNANESEFNSRQSANSKADDDAEAVIETVPACFIDLGTDKRCEPESLGGETDDPRRELEDAIETVDATLDDAAKADLEPDDKAEVESILEKDSEVDDLESVKASDETSDFDSLDHPNSSGTG